MLTLTELKALHDKAYNANTVTRERAADDMVFYHITQWDDNLLGETQLQYRGEFNILRKAGRQVISDLRSNPVQVDFEPTISGRDETSDLLDGLYRSDDRVNTTQEAYDTASMEAVVCGVGAWEIHTEWKTNRIGDKRQVIKRRPLNEANNNVFWDGNAKLMDKSDAGYVSILVPYTKDGYKDLVHELTGRDREDVDVGVSSFKNPEESYSFPWAAGNQDHIYVSTFYHREKIKDRVIELYDPLGQEMTLLESDLKEVMDELIEDGYTIGDDSKDIKRWEVTKYIASGAEILKTDSIAGQYIPVVPQYGERAYVEGEEHWEGVTRLAKDPQRLRNFAMSYLADIFSRSPRPKPIFYAGQTGQFASMYEEAGSDNNYPYYLLEEKDAQGNPYPLGPVGMMPEQTIPQALTQVLDQSRAAVEDVANPGVPQDIADADLSGKAVTALQNRLDQQSLVYQQNRKHALRRDAEIYASMASQINDCPCEVTLTMADGGRKKCQMMEPYMDEESGDMKVRNDLTNLEFEVFATIGTPYASQKEQTLERLGAMSQQLAQTNPGMSNMLVLEQLSMIDGINMKSIREYASKQLVIGKYRDPETEEEKQWLAEAQQNQPTDPNILIGQAEMGKAQAAQAEVQRKTQADQFKAQTDLKNTEVKQFEAQTKRMAVQVDAKEADANINFKRIDAMTRRVDAVNKNQFRTSATQQY